MAAPRVLPWSHACLRVVDQECIDRGVFFSPRKGGDESRYGAGLPGRRILSASASRYVRRWCAASAPDGFPGLGTHARTADLSYGCCRRAHPTQSETVVL